MFGFALLKWTSSEKALDYEHHAVENIFDLLNHTSADAIVGLHYK
jgi:hypothetical protein